VNIDELNKISERLAKGIRPNKEEVEDLIALARAQLQRSHDRRWVDEIAAEIKQRVERNMEALSKDRLRLPMEDGRPRCANCRHWREYIRENFHGFDHCGRTAVPDHDFSGHITTDMQSCSAWQEIPRE
jgi:hypothetical protein